MGNDFTLQQLRCFLAVTEEANFREAAERLRITQPPLSRQISALEKNLGVQLLSRPNTRAVHLTNAGRNFAQSARQMLALAERSRHEALQAAAAPSGTINFGFLESISLDLLPELIPQIDTEFPNISLMLREIHTTEQIQNLASRELDIGILRPPNHVEGLEVLPLRSDPLVAVLPDNHRLKSSPVAIAELAGESFVQYSLGRGENIQAAARLTCMAAGFSPQITQEVTSTPMLMSAVASHGCVALLPAPFAKSPQIGVRFLELLQPSVESTVAIAWRAGEETRVYRRIYDIARHIAGTQTVSSELPEVP